MSNRHESKWNERKEALMETLFRLWHLPDNFHWMAPLPLAHRRWILTLLLIIIVILLLPTQQSQPSLELPQSSQLVIEQEKKEEPSSQAALVINGRQPTSDTVSRPIQIMGNNAEIEPKEQVNPNNTQEDGWQTFQIQQGQTLSQLFRDNNLPVEDALALAKVEGSDKPISNLKAGQKIKIKRDDKNQIATIDIELPNQQQVFFIRQPNGGFYRYQ